jgi:hypothetical protein
MTDVLKLVEVPDLLKNDLHRYTYDNAEISYLSVRISEIIKKFTARKMQLYKRSISQRLDIKKTVQESLKYGGIPMELIYKEREEKTDIVLLIDVSESMIEWIGWVSIVACAVYRAIKGIRVYVFSNTIYEFDKYVTNPIAFLKEYNTLRRRNPNFDITNFLELFKKVKDIQLSNYTYIILLSDLIITPPGDELDRVNALAFIRNDVKQLINRIKGFYILDPIPGNMHVNEDGWYAIKGKDFRKYLTETFNWDGNSPVAWQSFENKYVNEIKPSEVEIIEKEYYEKTILKYFSAWKELERFGAVHQIVNKPLDVIEALSYAVKVSG